MRLEMLKSPISNHKISNNQTTYLKIYALNRFLGWPLATIVRGAFFIFIYNSKLNPRFR